MSLLHVLSVIALSAVTGCAHAPPSSSAARPPRELVASTTGIQPRPEPAPEPVEGGPPPWTAADVAGAPAPGDESGRVDAGERSASTLRWIGRVLLFIPRLMFEAISQPIRGGIYVTERYRLPARYDELFYNDAHTFGLLPWVWLDSTDGLSVGAKLVVGRADRWHVRGSAGTGGTYRQLYTLSLRSPELAGRLALRLDGDYRDRDAPFYGLGNHDTGAAPATAIDPTVDNTAVDTRYQKRSARAATAADLRLAGDLHLRATAIYSDIGLGEARSGVALEQVYDASAIVGFDGYRTRYGELELRWNDRHPVSPWEPRRAAPPGWVLSAFAGWDSVTAGASFLRYGTDLQYAIRVGPGPRTVVARLYGEAVSGARDEVPLLELPVLGGSQLLRGYPEERFRDRIAALGTLEYDWDLSKPVLASVFVDAGRVYPRFSELSVDALRCGFGVALEAHRYTGFLARASLESSIDGGLFVRLRFEEPFSPHRRERYR